MRSWRRAHSSSFFDLASAWGFKVRPPFVPLTRLSGQPFFDVLGRNDLIEVWTLVGVGAGVGGMAIDKKEYVQPRLTHPSANCHITIARTYPRPTGTTRRPREPRADSPERAPGLHFYTQAWSTCRNRPGCAGALNPPVP